jgi:hypothetical protein
VNPQEPTIASPAVNVPPPEETRPKEPITTSLAVATPSSGQVFFYYQIIFILFYAALLTCLPSGPELLGIARV